jgi:flagellin-like protein
LNKAKLAKNSKAISPIIATLLLILIAIAAGVVVYAYVLGFIGNSTGNSGATTDTLSIDQVNLFGSKATVAPVTVFVRNEGPSTESFNTGFYVKSGTLNDQLVPAYVVSGAGATDTITQLAVTYASATSLTVTVTGCSSTDSMTVKAFGVSGSANCASGVATIPLSLVGTGLTVSSTFNSLPISFTGVNVGTGGAPDVVGLPISTGTISIAINTVGQITLGMSGSQGASSILSTGSTYSAQVVGTDGASTALSAKAA